MKKIALLTLMLIVTLLLSGCCCCGKFGNSNTPEAVNTPSGSTEITTSETTETGTSETTETGTSETTETTGTSEATKGNLEIENFTYLETKDGPTTEKNTIKKGETLWYQFEVKGAEKDSEGKVWLVEDFAIENTAGEELLRNNEMLNYHEKNKGNVVVTNNYSSSPNDTPAQYVAHVIIKDKNSGAVIEARYNFEITE